MSYGYFHGTDELEFTVSDAELIRRAEDRTSRQRVLGRGNRNAAPHRHGGRPPGTHIRPGGRGTLIILLVVFIMWLGSVGRHEVPREQQARQTRPAPTRPVNRAQGQNSGHPESSQTARRSVTPPVEIPINRTEGGTQQDGQEFECRELVLDFVSFHDFDDLDPEDTLPPGWITVFLYAELPLYRRIGDYWSPSKPAPEGAWILIGPAKAEAGDWHPVMGADGEFASHACLTVPGLDPAARRPLPPGWRRGWFRGEREAVARDVDRVLALMITQDGLLSGYIYQKDFSMVGPL